MITEELLAFIRKERDRKVSNLDIRGMLVAHGWTKEQIDEGFERVDGTSITTEGLDQGQLPTTKDFLKESWNIFKKNILFFLKLAAHYTVYLTGLFVISALFFMMGVGAFSLGISTHSYIAVAIAGGSLLILIGLAILFVGATYVKAYYTGSFFYRIAEPHMPLFEAISRSHKRAWSLLLTSILLGLVCLFGFTLFIIPVFIVWFWTLFAEYITIFEDMSGRDALAKSRFYIRGFVLKIIERILPLIVGYVVLQAIYQFLAYTDNTIAHILMIPIWFLTIAFALYMKVAFFVLYQHIRTAKEGMSPDERVFAKDKKRFMWFAIGGLILPVILIASSVFFISRLNPETISKIESVFEEAFIQKYQPNSSNEIQFDPQPEMFDPNFPEGEYQDLNIDEAGDTFVQ